MGDDIKEESQQTEEGVEQTSTDVDASESSEPVTPKISEEESEEQAE